MEENQDKKENKLFSEQISKDKLDFLKIGSSFTKQKINQSDNKEKNNNILFKKKAVDYFDSSDEEILNAKIKYSDLDDQVAYKNDEISDFSESESKNVPVSNIKNKINNIKEKEIKKHNLLNKYILDIVEPSSFNFSQTTKLDLYNADEILNHATNLLSNKRKKRFYKKFELKYMKFKDNDIAFTFESIAKRENYQYGSFLAKDVPLFYRITDRHIIGLRNKKLSKEILKELNIMTNQQTAQREKKLIRYYDKSQYKKIGLSEKYITNQTNFNFTRDYIPITDKFVNIDPAITESILERKIDYNLIDDERTKYFLERNKYFNQKLAEEPTNLKLWLQFIKYQDKSNPCKTDNQKLDRTLTILDKCLKHKSNESNLYLNVLYLRIYEDFSEGKFEKINQMWITKLNLLSHEAFFLREYINFLKYNKLLNMNKLRDHFLFLLKYYEALFENSKDLYFKELYTKLIIDIMLYYICWEVEAGFYEAGFNTLRSFIEIKILQLKNIMKYNSISNDYINYFESDFPKIGDLENVLGFYDYVNKKNQKVLNQFNSISFIENFKTKKTLNITFNHEKFKEFDINYLKFISWTENEIISKNYRPYNITYDKEVLLIKPESFMFFSDVKEYLNLKFLLTDDTLLYLLKKMWTFIKIDNDINTCLACQDYNKIYLLDKTNIKKISFLDKMIIYSNNNIKNFQKVELFYRLLTYIENMGFLKEDILIMKMDLNMISEHFKGTRFLTSKKFLKENSDNIRLWLNYYQWCLYFDRFEEADKIIKVLYINEKNIINPSLNALFFSYLIRHYYFSIIFYPDKYCIQDLLEVFDLVVNYLINGFNKSKYIKSNNLTRLSNLNKLEKWLFNLGKGEDSNEDNSLMIEKDKTIFCLIVEVLLLRGLIETDILIQINEGLHSTLIKKFRLYSKFAYIFNKENNLGRVNCDHILKQNLSFIFLRTLEYVKKYDKLFSPSNNTEVLEFLNNYCGNDNDLLIFIYADHVTQFSNVIDRDFRFINHFNENFSLKHGFYLLINKFKNESNIYSMDYLLSSWKDCWKTYSKNLQKLSNGFDSFESSNELIKTKNFAYKLNSRACPYFFINFWKELIQLIDLKCQNHQKLNKIEEYSLFIHHEYSYNKESFLKFMKTIIKYFTDDEKKQYLEEYLIHKDDSNEIKENRLVRDIKRMYDIIETKEIRIYKQLEFE